MRAGAGVSSAAAGASAWIVAATMFSGAGGVKCAPGRVARRATKLAGSRARQRKKTPIPGGRFLEGAEGSRCARRGRRVRLPRAHSAMPRPRADTPHPLDDADDAGGSARSVSRVGFADVAITVAPVDPPPSILEDEAAFVGDATARPPPRRLPSARSRKKQAISIFVGKKDKYGGEGELDASKRLRVLAHRVGYSVRPSRRRVARHPDDGGRLRLLRDVTAVFEPGEVTALMGPSGAGKTTLLDVISGRKTAGEITGRVLLGPECVPATKDVLKSVSAYVEQNDALLANLTVRETLLYQAELKCDPAEPAAVRETYVDKLLELLKLTPCRDVAVGDALTRRISGGQSKRANIGVALVTRPRVLFLDEPTSGLDSETSSDVVEVMRALAQSGVTVLATIHSPSSEAFRRFDALLMLREGRVSYCGPLFGPNGAVAYFDRLGAEPHDPNTNLADYLISVVATDDVDWVEAFAASDAKRRNSLKLAEWISSNPKHAKVEPGAILKRRLSLSLRDAGDHFGGIEIRPRGGAARAVRVLTRWRTRANYASPKWLAQRSAGSLIFSLVLSSVYADQGRSETRDMANQLNVAALLFMCNILPAYAASGNMPSIVLERPLFYRERDDGCYPVFAYVAHKAIEEGAIGLLVTLVGQAIVYAVVGLRGSFLRYWLVYWLVQQSGVALAYVCASLAPNMDAANTLLPVYNTCQLLFSGLLIRRKDIAPGWAWWPHTLFVRYGWQAQLMNHFGRNREPPAFVDSETGETVGVAAYYGADGLDWGANVGYILLCWFCWLAIAGVVLSKVRHGKR